MKDEPRRDQRTDPARAALHEVVRGTATAASDLVHALRNPVSGLITSIDLITSGVADADDTKQLFRVMRNELAKLNDMLEHCRELTRLRDIEVAPRDLAALVRGRVASRTADVGLRGITVALDVADAPVPAVLDEALLGDAVDALVLNALEAMPEGGTLRVALAHDAAKREATLTVTDTGVGIAPAALPNVFRLFYTSKKGGAGVGLSAARQVVLAHGGRIAVESKQGAGTTVTVALPTA